MILGAQETLRDAGVLMVLMDSQHDADLEEREITTLRQHQVDGILYGAFYHRELELPRLLEGIPTVVLDAETRRSAVSWVVPDETAGARMAVEELLAHGHRRIGFVTNEDDIPAVHLRLRGYETALRKAGVRVDPRLISAAPPTAEGGYRAARHLLDRRGRPTALFCFRDVMAMGAYHAAAELGLRIPAELSIIGYDNMSEVAVGLFPGLTTVELPHYEMGCWAAREVLSLTGSTPGRPKHARLRGRLVRRSSVATAAR